MSPLVLALAVLGQSPQAATKMTPQAVTAAPQATYYAAPQATYQAQAVYSEAVTYGVPTAACGTQATYGAAAPQGFFRKFKQKTVIKQGRGLGLCRGRRARSAC